MEVLPPIFGFAWMKTTTTRDAWCEWKADRDTPVYGHPSASYIWVATPSTLAFIGIKNCSRRTRTHAGKSNNWTSIRNMCTPLRRKLELPLRPRKLLIADVTRLQPYIIGGDSFWEHIEALISYNLRNDGFQQDCIYIEQGHLMTPMIYESLNGYRSTKDSSSIMDAYTSLYTAGGVPALVSTAITIV